METLFLEGPAVDGTIRRLVAEHDELHWAVAWGSCDAHGRWLIKHKAKFKRVTFGVAFSQTDPDLVEALVNVRGAFVATKFKSGTFHPKVYAFKSGGQAAAVIGSANFTGGAFARNREAAILVTGSASESLFKDLFRFVRQSASFGEPVTRAYATAYRASCVRAARLEKPPRDPVPPRKDVGFAQLTSPCATMKWQDYVRKVRSTPEHDIPKSLHLLRTAQGWFAEKDSFRVSARRSARRSQGSSGNRTIRNWGSNGVGSDRWSGLARSRTGSTRMISI